VTRNKDFAEYFDATFHHSAGELALIENVIAYVRGLPPEQKEEALHKIFDGAYDFTEPEFLKLYNSTLK